jgi:hypothetical protein
MFVLKTVILFMHADNIFQKNGLALGIRSIAIKIFDVAQAVTTQRELVGV